MKNYTFSIEVFTDLMLNKFFVQFASKRITCVSVILFKLNIQMITFLYTFMKMNFLLISIFNLICNILRCCEGI